MWADHLFDLGLRLGRIVPSGVAWWLGGLIGYAYAGLPGKEQRRCRQHLEAALGGDRAALTRRVFRHLGRSMLWNLTTLHHDPLRLPVRIQNWAAARACFRDAHAGIGTVALSGHLGNWELLARVFGRITETAVLGRRMRSPVADRLVMRLRSQWGNRVFYQDDDMRTMAGALRRGLVLGTLPDQDVGRLSGGFVPFFGQLAYTPLGPAAIAQVARVPVQFIYCVYDGRCWVLHFGPRYQLPRSRDRQSQQVALMARCMAYQEALVRRYPEQWVWFHRRWRRQPRDRPEAMIWNAAAQHQSGEEKEKYRLQPVLTDAGDPPLSKQVL
jgi:Kdo2-lipid IVA lauroyltransferase/acyltransferase